MIIDAAAITLALVALGVFGAGITIFLQRANRSGA